MRYFLYQNQIIYIYIFLYIQTRKHTNTVFYHQFIIINLFKLFEELRSLEVVRNLLVESCNNFVDLFFPARFRVFAGLHGVEELAEGDVQDGQKVFRNLKSKKNENIIKTLQD